MGAQGKPVVLVGQKFVEGSWMHGPMLPHDIFGDFCKKVEVRYLEPATTERLLRQIPDCDLLVRGAHIPVTREAIASAKRLIGVLQVGIGLEHIDIEAATEHGVMVANTPYHVDSVAEGAVLLMLSVSRTFLKMIAAGRTGVELGLEYLGTELHKKRLGIIGLGRIGSRVARIAVGMGTEISSVAGHGDRATIRELGVRLCRLDDLLRECDFVVLTCPLTPETRNLIGERELGLMKRTAFLINVARGQVVDEKALYRALREGWIAGAGLDVYVDEPLRPDNPLLELPNVVATPHCIGGTWEGRRKVFDGVLDAMERILVGEPPVFLVNPEVINRARASALRRE